MTEKNRRTKREGKQLGQGLVEFALILPLLLLLMWGIIEFGRLLVMYTEVSNAAREAVRYGVAKGLPGEDTHHLDCAGIVSHGSAVSALVPLDRYDFDIRYDHGEGATFGECWNEPPGDHEVILGDRMVVTVTKEVRPIVLFQNAGPFKLQFVTARTIVHGGIPMERVGGLVGITGSPFLEFNLTNPVSCSGWFTWTEVPGATAYTLKRTVPISEAGIIDNPLAPPYPPEGSIPDRISVENGQEYRILASSALGDGPLSNIVVIGGCSSTIPQVTNFVHSVTPDPCEATFSWDAVTDPDVEGLRIYEGGTLVADLPAGDTSYSRAVTNAEQYLIRAYIEPDEGPDSDVATIVGCVLPAPPENLAVVYDQKSPIPDCRAHFSWDEVTGAIGYNLYREGALIANCDSGDYDHCPAITDYRFVDQGSLPIINGTYTVTALFPGVESDSSDTLTVDGCYALNTTINGVRYFLHSDEVFWQVPQGHGYWPSPDWPAEDSNNVNMDERDPDIYTPFPFTTLYDYNESGGMNPGREIDKGGGIPSGETDENNYLAWYSPVQERNLTLVGNVVLHIWVQNPVNTFVDQSVYLYLYTPGGSWSLPIASATYTWPKNVVTWQEHTFNLSPSTTLVPAGSQLVVWTHADANKGLSFAYDTTNYDSHIEFSGSWAP